MVRLFSLFALLALDAAAGANLQVAAWGADFLGQSSPPALSGVTHIAAGASHSVALLSGGTVVAWGDNSLGETTVPSGLTTVIAIAAGSENTIALRANGTPAVWGGNGSGQLTLPAAATSLVAVSAGSAHLLALRANGSVIAWGLNNRGQCNVPATLVNAKAISAGSFHNVAVTEDGVAVAWGINANNESTVPAGAQSGVIAVAAGGAHSLALKTNGTVVGWGDNSFGQITIPAFSAPVKAIAASARTSYALLTTGAIVAWGDGAQGQKTLPVGLGKAEEISAGGLHALALLEPTAPALIAAPILSGDTQRLNLQLPTSAIGEIKLLCDQPSLLTVPASVNAVGSNVEVIVSATDVASAANIVVKAFVNRTQGAGTSISRTLTPLAELHMRATPAGLARLDAVDPEVFGGTSAACRVSLNGTAGPGGAVVDIASLDPGLLTVAASATIDQGNRSTTFGATASPVDAEAVGTVRAKFQELTRTATITVKPAAPKDVVLSAPSVTGGTNLNGNLARLRGVAGPAGTDLVLGTSNPAVATVPPVLSVAPGGTQVSFKITTFPVAAPTDVTIFVSGAGGSVSKTVTVTP